MNKLSRILVLLLSLAGVLFIRFYEQHLFYDPLIEFFRYEQHQQSALPDLDMGSYIWNMAYRFLLNGIFSLLAIWALFGKKEYIKLSVILFGALLLVLLLVLYLILTTSQSGSYMGLFYVRRFLMQPLFALLLIPAFYFHKKA